MTALLASANQRLDRFDRYLPWLSTAVRLALAWVWFDAGWHKFIDPEGTIRSVRAFQLLPEVLVPPFGYALPLVELVLAVLLVLGLLTRVSAAITAAMMIMFMFGIGHAWASGLTIECGCFGTGGGPFDAVAGYKLDLARDTGFLLLAALLWLRPRSRYCLDGLLKLTPEA